MTMFKLIPLLCTHVYSYMFSIVHPPRVAHTSKCVMWTYYKLTLVPPGSPAAQGSSHLINMLWNELLPSQNISHGPKIGVKSYVLYCNDANSATNGITCLWTFVAFNGLSNPINFKVFTTLHFFGLGWPTSTQGPMPIVLCQWKNNADLFWWYICTCSNDTWQVYSHACQWLMTRIFIMVAFIEHVRY